MDTAGVLVSVVVITLVFLALVWRILAQIRVLGPGLVLLGLVTAMAAMCYGTFGAAGPVKDAIVTVGVTGQAGILMRIGVILVLAGIVACLAADWSPLVSQRQETNHAEQS